MQIIRREVTFVVRTAPLEVAFDLIDTGRFRLVDGLREFNGFRMSNIRFASLFLLFVVDSFK